VASRPATP